MTDVGDTDSLFGSPPSSPRPASRGRSPSLALPGSSTTHTVGGESAFKNVGTIALPGSHTSSEPLVNLPASPPRQRLQVVQRIEPQSRAIAAQAQASNLDLTRERDRANSVAATAPRARPPKPSKRKAKSATPVPSSAPSGPSLSIPEVDGPLPPNFLRSQQALLGLAGVVAGLKPSQLSTRSSRGTSAQNPIVVEDDVPSISNSVWKARQSQLPSNLPVPNEQAIVDTLITQQNIFPVIRSLLPTFPVLGSTEVGCCTGSHVPIYAHGNTTYAGERDGQAAKKRKITSVPAGAGDWDVPYPFENGEGPKGYRQTWEKEREKKLVKELISLIREAVQKAAAKSYVQDQDVERPMKKSKPEYRPGIYYKSQLPKSPEPISGSLQDDRHPSVQPVSAPAASVVHSLTPVPDNDWSGFSTELESLLASLNNDYNSNGNLLSTTTMDFASTVSNSPTLTSSTRLSTPFDLSKTTPAEKENVSLANEFVRLAGSASSTDAGLDFGLENFSIPDIPIDPVLLDLLPPPTIDPSLDLSNSTQTNDAVLDKDPGDGQADQGLINEDLTQISSASENTSLTLAIPPILQTPSISSLNNSPPSTLSSSQFTQLIPSPPLPHTQQPLASQPPILPYRPPSVVGGVSQNDGPSTRPVRGVMFLPPVTGAPQKRSLDRDEVLRKAKARREQLAAELARTRVELWETTIEQGVLLNLLKDDELK